ncbi:hypothetical protein H6F67_25825 [Microcoleus sp. FACHB-1515]|uniref:hypothetical protein n=1 Tax=Cyanophyceae TaxID=3028117 RepID=UPI001685E245|nr:hypothetical protein [Microcoleus sp. FACHB-1515]MBD2093268.1 hypothetical protein [Microcoleus sp. FACHB-1515]
MKSTAPKKKAFSKFRLDEAYKQLNLTQLTSWKIKFNPVPPSDAFQTHLDRLQVFDVGRSEEGKKLIIDAILIEALQPFKRLKFWKGATLESEVAHGAADYLMTENRGYFEAPFLCIVEAKKDDFEQGLAQCLVEMQACLWSNQAIDRTIDVFGIVTSGEGWKFYRLDLAGAVHETLLYSVSDTNSILGILHSIFELCEQNLQQQENTP